ncbi:TetR/AcrR family transcriptional regulator [Arthrobacter sp. ISL-5]|uniref:TetR/AcrR family transcriptional regulator n=1 Tax=Arthrobacter sp. ISL-5 TaxID=2819111 RepID=UPI001BE751C1|nr:TetR family transcriptional regulator C-terminal domain-containing protein [Arthrobacter sp. ISL-5]MBT2554331.1 TetR family transcriptional regulator C-terminal domain-containing protein [Arthrobacter sp. ISL-5]
MPKIVDAAARRQEIVDAVCRIIATDGLERASLREVADEAGLAVGSVRHYFASSEELLAFSFSAVVDRILARLAAALAGVSRTSGPEEQHEAVLTLLSEFLPLDEERALDACAWLAFKNAARIRPFLAAEADRSHRAVAAVVGQLITRLLAGDDVAGNDLAEDARTGNTLTADDGGEHLVTEAERLLATLDGLTMHALLQPAWLTREMCRDVLESHLAGLRRTAGASH